MLAHLRGYKCSGRVSGVGTARAQLLVLPRASRASDPAGSRPGCAGELAEAAGQAGGFEEGLATALRSASRCDADAELGYLGAYLLLEDIGPPT